jgi:hypothetical protein
MPTRIWLGSWNLDSVNPTAAMLQQWLNASNPQASACDIVVLGLQEAKNTDDNGIDVETLGQEARAFLPNHNWHTEHTLEGHTKTADNCQSLAIVCNLTAGNLAMFNHTGGNNVLWAFESFGTAPKTDKFLQKVRKFVGQGEKGKGGIIGQVRYNNRTFAFTTAHLDSHNNGDRIQQIWQLQNKITQLQPEVAFFMGDLNYRLQIPIPPNPNDLRLDNVASQICSPIGRQQLLLRDTLPSFGTLTGTWGYTFPPPRGVVNSVAGDIIFPTYKRTKLAPAPANYLLPQAAQVLTCVKASYGFGIAKEDKVEYVKESRGGEIDLGWLDRVGYRTYGIPAKFTVVAFGADHGLNISDHVPIYMVVDVN